MWTPRRGAVGIVGGCEGAGTAQGSAPTTRSVGVAFDQVGFQERKVPGTSKQTVMPQNGRCFPGRPKPTMTQIASWFALLRCRMPRRRASSVPRRPRTQLSSRAHEFLAAAADPNRRPSLARIRHWRLRLLLIGRQQQPVRLRNAELLSQAH
jgi:hypothetical protein